MEGEVKKQIVFATPDDLPKWLPEWLPSALLSRAEWGEKTGEDSHGTSRLMRQVSHLLTTGIWREDLP